MRRKMLVLCFFLIGVVAIASQKQTPRQYASKDVEIVFVLDTTGSMGGLIESAKRKIWSIVNDLLQNMDRGTRVKIGLVAYRDRNDAYVVNPFPLSGNLDDVYVNLMGFKAEGGGDEPEDVRQALHVAVQKMNWSKPGKTVSQIVFLVGDARPHTDYKDFPTTVNTAKSAAKKGIVINAIQCGNLGMTEKYWRQIAQNTNGQYFRIAQDGGTTTVSTPYDDQLRNLGDEMDKIYIPFGKAENRSASLTAAADKRDRIKKTASMEAGAARSVNKSLNSYAYSADDLIQAVENKEKKLKDIKTDELPTEMREMTAAQREEYVREKIEERKNIREKIADLSRKRSQWIRENTAVRADSFDQSVSEALRAQIK
ncbi:MAG: VWA domain-containing protein [Fusobacteriaceae bacterium]|jgi:Mg-chelatase subunit ChlD|nr:VWA domain-containing protein [Fusobacteriaceae bacterium]